MLTLFFCRCHGFYPPLSYLIQNFTYPYYTPRVNVRIRSLFLIRNVATLYVLFAAPSKAFSSHAFTRQNVLPLSYLNDAMFGAVSKVVLSKVKKLKHVPIGFNFARTAYFNTLATLDSMLSNTFSTVRLCTGVRSAITYPYSTSLPIVHTPVSKRPFSYTIYKFLHMSLNVWFRWPLHYQLSTHYSNVHKHWMLLKFLNNYYFKVYNL